MTHPLTLVSGYGLLPSITKLISIMMKCLGNQCFLGLRHLIAGMGSSPPRNIQTRVFSMRCLDLWPTDAFLQGFTIGLDSRFPKTQCFYVSWISLCSGECWKLSLVQLKCLPQFSWRYRWACSTPRSDQDLLGSRVLHMNPWLLIPSLTFLFCSWYSHLRSDFWLRPRGMEHNLSPVVGLQQSHLG